VCCGIQDSDIDVVISAAAPSPVQIVGGIIDSILDEMFPAETAASDIICTLLDKVMTSIKRRGLFGSVLSPQFFVLLSRLDGFVALKQRCKFLTFYAEILETGEIIM